MDDQVENELQSSTFLSVLEDKLFTPGYQHIIILILGLVAGISTGLTIEYHTLFEQNRTVPFWETIIVASVTSSLSLWLSMLIIRIASKIYLRKH